MHFANESLDLHSRGGRLSADIQAVVAADYIRNLKEETRKGIYGRLKQGVYPFPAPLGYRNTGAGKPKEPDLLKAPLVCKVFEFYATGRYSLDTLVAELHRLGLRNRNGGKVTRNGLSVILNNPFYIGLIRLRRTGETFPGSHAPLVSKALFDRVQRILNGKTQSREGSHNLLFRRLLACRHCGYSLVGEIQKGHVYYRCHTRSCPTTGIREEPVEEKILEELSALQLSPEEKIYLQKRVNQLKKDWEDERGNRINALTMSLSQVQDRLARLTDAFLDGVIEKRLFEERKTALLMQRQDWEEKLAELKAGTRSLPDQLSEFLELAGSAYLTYKMALPEEKRDLLEIATSNRLVEEKNVIVKLSPPFHEVAKRFQNSNGGPHRDRPRTLDALLDKLTKLAAIQQLPVAVGSSRPENLSEVSQ